MHQHCFHPTPSPSTSHYFHLCSAPSAFQHADTVCLPLPYLRAMSLKLGLMPASLYMSNSPIMPPPRTLLPYGRLVRASAYRGSGLPRPRPLGPSLHIGSPTP